MKFRSFTYTLLSLIAFSSLANAAVMAQNPAPQGGAAVPSGTSPAPAPAAPAPTQAPVSIPAPGPAGAKANPLMPPPPPLGGSEAFPRQPVPATPSQLKAPGIEAILPSQLQVSGVAAMVNGQPITYQELVTKFISAGAPQFIDELINEDLIRQEAKKEGIVVTPAQVDAKLLEAKKFLLPQYPGESWGQFLASQGRSESYIRANIYDGLLAVKLVEKTKPFQSLTGKIHIYHILKLTMPMTGGPVPVSDETAKQEIQNIRDLIVSGKASFQDEARKESQDSSAVNGGDLGWVANDGTLDGMFATAAFALKEGEISQPVKSRFGWHIILNAKDGDHASKADIATYNSTPQQDARARAQIQTYLKQLRASSKIVNYILQKPQPNKPDSAVILTHPMLRTVKPTKPAAK